MSETSSSAPVVSIVIPAYTCERFIAETLRGIQAQTLREWECIIVDDGSRDGTLALVQQFAAEDPRFRVVAQPNTGPAVARNNGLTHIDPRSEYIIFMDSDDIWLPEALEVLRREIESHPDAIGAHGQGRCINREGVVYVDPVYASNGKGRFVCDAIGRMRTLSPTEPTSFRSLWFSNPYPPGLILTRRIAYDRAGVFDTKVCPIEDWDMVIRLSRHGHFRFIDQVLLSYRRHDNNYSVQASPVMAQQIRNLLHKTFYSPENNEEQRRIVKQNWRAAQMLHFRQNLDLIKENITALRFGQAASAAVSSLVHLGRMLRGYPTPRGPWIETGAAREALRLAVSNTTT